MSSHKLVTSSGNWCIDCKQYEQNCKCHSELSLARLLAAEETLKCLINKMVDEGESLAGNFPPGWIANYACERHAIHKTIEVIKSRSVAATGKVSDE